MFNSFNHKNELRIEILKHILRGKLISKKNINTE